MKQVLQNLRTGITELINVPAPRVGPNELLISTTRSLISAGTERMLIDFGKAGPITKARQQPDKVRMVLDKIKTDGIGPTIAAVRHKLDQPIALGYSNAGYVIEVGSAVQGFAQGDRVASNGKHAEIVTVPVNLCARIPDAVTDDEAAFTVLGAIALQGIRLLQPTLGEAIVVAGLGLVGQITVQLLRAQGCRVLALDYFKARLDLASASGAETFDLSQGDPFLFAERFSRGRGVDGVVVTASTKSSEPIHQAAQMCRKRGRIVLVGVTGLELSRADFFEKELTFQVSCSYGPGRYDPVYEEKGQDYPVGFVRWTEQRNFEAVLDMMTAGRLQVAPLISHRFDIAAAEEAYQALASDEPSLGILLQYPKQAVQIARSIAVLPGLPKSRPGSIAKSEQARVAFLGSGNYATSVLMPAFKAAGARLQTVVSRNGVSSTFAARKFGFETASTDPTAVLSDPGVNVVVVATRHNTHARFVCDALAAGKHVFVEKPLGITLRELDEIAQAYEATQRNSLVMVGLNRRFAPQTKRIEQLLDTVPGPKAFVMTVNAGAVPPTHWTQDTNVGGGRIIGEGCHFVDLLRHLAKSPIVSESATALRTSSIIDTASLHLTFGDGSLGTIHYLSNGNKSFPKERLEIFAGGRVLQLDNFRRLAGYGWPSFSQMVLWRQDKGQTACVSSFVAAVVNGAPSPIPFDELLDVARSTVRLANYLDS